MIDKTQRTSRVGWFVENKARDARVNDLAAQAESMTSLTAFVSRLPEWDEWKNVSPARLLAGRPRAQTHPGDAQAAQNGRPIANVHVLSLHGEIDSSRKQWIEQELGDIERFGPGAVTILDLTDVRYLDSTFLGALMQVQKRARNEQPQSDVCIVAPRSSSISRLFLNSNLDNVFRMFDDILSAHWYVGDRGYC